MFKLVVLSGLLAVALGKPSNLVLPLVDKLVSEKTIESHGNSVIHAAAPVIPSVNIPLVNTDGQNVLPVGIPYVASAAPLASTAAPITVVQTKQFIETSEKSQASSEKSESLQKSKQVIEKVEAIAQHSNQIQSQEKDEPNLRQSSETQQKNETSQNKEYSQIIDTQGQFIYHAATPSILTPQGVTFTNALIPPYVVPAEVAVTLIPHRPATDSSQKPEDVQKVKSIESKQHIAGKLTLDNGAITEVATGLHLAPAPLYFYPYPAAVVAEKSISSFGHSIIHGA